MKQKWTNIIMDHFVYGEKVVPLHRQKKITKMKENDEFAYLVYLELTTNENVSVISLDKTFDDISSAIDYYEWILKFRIPEKYEIVRENYNDDERIAEYISNDFLELHKYCFVVIKKVRN